MSHQTTDLVPVFRRAAEVILTRGHHTGAMTATCSRHDDCGTPVCAVGALRVAGGSHPDRDDSPAAEAAINYLSPRVVSNVVDSDPLERIADWNDADGRTGGEVAAELRLVGDALADEHYALVPLRVRTADGSRWRLASTVQGVPRYVLAFWPTDAPLGVQISLGELAERFGAPSAWGGAA